MLKYDARNDQSELILLARLGEIGNASPELVHRDVEFVNCNHQVDKQTIYHLLDARIAVSTVEPGGTGSKSGDNVLPDQIVSHLNILPSSIQSLRIRASRSGLRTRHDICVRPRWSNWNRIGHSGCARRRLRGCKLEVMADIAASPVASVRDRIGQSSGERP